MRRCSGASLIRPTRCCIHLATSAAVRFGSGSGSGSLCPESVSARPRVSAANCSARLLMTHSTSFPSPCKGEVVRLVEFLQRVWESPARPAFPRGRSRLRRRVSSAGRNPAKQTSVEGVWVQRIRIVVQRLTRPRDQVKRSRSSSSVVPQKTRSVENSATLAAPARSRGRSSMGRCGHDHSLRRTGPENPGFNSLWIVQDPPDSL